MANLTIGEFIQHIDQLACDKVNSHNWKCRTRRCDGSDRQHVQTHVTPEMLHAGGGFRINAVSRARRWVFYFLYRIQEIERLSTVTIGKKYGLDHTSVLHAIRKAECTVTDRPESLEVQLMREMREEVKPLIGLL